MNYRFKAHIEDEDGTIITKCSAPVYNVKADGGCEAVEIELFSMLRGFRQHELAERDDA